MESNQLNLSTYHDWLGNIDFGVMCKTYLEDGEDEDDDDGTFQVEHLEGTEDGSVAPKWWELDYEVWSQNFDGSNQLTESAPAGIPYHVENGFINNLDLQPPHSLADMERYQIIGDAGDAIGHCGTTLEESTLDALYAPRESLAGTWAPYDPLDPSTSGGQDCFKDPALESILRHLGDGGAGIEESAYDAVDSLMFLNDPASLATDDQLESAGPAFTGDSHQIPASDVLGKMKASRKHRVRGPKNWEFLMRMLVNPATNPALIAWEDEELGIFRLKNPQFIAQLWASRNGNSTDLSYNNFARGLRHHYKKGILIPIPEKQLVYKCGQKALEYLNQIRCSQVPQ